MRLPDPSPVLDKNRAPMGPEILSSTGAGIWRKAPMAFPDSSSVLDKFQSARCYDPHTPGRIFSVSWHSHKNPAEHLLMHAQHCDPGGLGEGVDLPKGAKLPGSGAKILLGLRGKSQEKVSRTGANPFLHRCNPFSHQCERLFPDFCPGGPKEF